MSGEAIALILGVDRILDMCRTVPNITGDILTSVVVARSEGYALVPATAPDWSTAAAEEVAGRAADEAAARDAEGRADSATPAPDRLPDPGVHA